MSKVQGGISLPLPSKAGPRSPRQGMGGACVPRAVLGSVDMGRESFQDRPMLRRSQGPRLSPQNRSTPLELPRPVMHLHAFDLPYAFLGSPGENN